MWAFAYSQKVANTIFSIALPTTSRSLYISITWSNHMNRQYNEDDSGLFIREIEIEQEFSQLSSRMRGIGSTKLHARLLPISWDTSLLRACSAAREFILGHSLLSAASSTCAQTTNSYSLNWKFIHGENIAVSFHINSFQLCCASNSAGIDCRVCVLLRDMVNFAGNVYL